MVWLNVMETSRQCPLKTCAVEPLQPIIEAHIDKDSKVSTDELPTYVNLSDIGYNHSFVKHAQKQFVNGKAHVQTIEGFWARLKLSIKRTHVWCSGKHLSKYVDEFAFRHNHRKEPEMMFSHVLHNLTLPS